MKKASHSAATASVANPAIVSGDFLSSPLMSPVLFLPERMVSYLGVVNYSTNDRVLAEIKRLMAEDPLAPMVMTVTSAGGPSGTAMGFYDTVRSVLKPNLITIGSGDVDSSAVLLFLTGERRYVTKHTTLLFHLAGRVFKPEQRFTVDEMEAMLAEDKIKDEYYAGIVADRSGGKLNKKKVLTLMRKQTVMRPDDLIRYGLADEILV